MPRWERVFTPERWRQMCEKPYKPKRQSWKAYQKQVLRTTPVGKNRRPRTKQYRLLPHRRTRRGAAVWIHDLFFGGRRNGPAANMRRRVWQGAGMKTGLVQYTDTLVCVQKMRTCRGMFDHFSAKHMPWQHERW